MTNHNPDNRTNKIEETVNTRSATPSEVSYRDGYVDGQISDDRLRQEENLIRQEENLKIRDNDNAARGLLIGILLTSLVGLVVGAIFFAYTNRQTEPTETIVPSPTLVPAPSSDVTEPQEPQKQTTVIERTVEKVVPVPQQQSPVPSEPAPPAKVEINVPKPEPARPQPSTNQNQTQTSPAQPSSQSRTSQSQPIPSRETQSESNQSSDSQDQLQPNTQTGRDSTLENQPTAPNSP